jgi:hypothetical protein
MRSKTPNRPYFKTCPKWQAMELFVAYCYACGTANIELRLSGMEMYILNDCGIILCSLVLDEEARILPSRCLFLIC